MKKNLFFIILAALCSLGSAAQNDGSFGFIEEKPKSNALFVGPTIGGTMTMTSGQTADYDLIDGGGFGFTGGVAARARFGRATENSIEGTGMLGVGLEVKYKLNSVKTHAEDKLSLGYLEIPVTIQFFPFAKMHGLNGLYIEAGPDFAMLMSKSPDVLRHSINLPYPGLQALEYKTGDLKGGDLRVAMGLGYQLPDLGLGINARYYLGMSELSKNAIPVKLNTLEVSLSWMFKVASF